MAQVEPLKLNYAARLRHPATKVESHTLNSGTNRDIPLTLHTGSMLSERVQARITRDFGRVRQADVAQLLDGLEWHSIGDSDDARERIHTAILVAAAGDPHRLSEAAHLARLDYRDLLMNTGLDGRDWRTRIDAELGPPPTQPFLRLLWRLRRPLQHP